MKTILKLQKEKEKDSLKSYSLIVMVMEEILLSLGNQVSSVKKILLMRKLFTLWGDQKKMEHHTMKSFLT